MRKICIVLVVVFACLFNNTPVEAISVDNEGREWWNFFEVLEIAENNYDDIVRVCGRDDMECMFSLYDRKNNDVPKNNMFYGEVSLSMISVNPSTGNAEFYFNSSPSDIFSYHNNGVIEIEHIWIAGPLNDNNLKDVIVVNSNNTHIYDDVFYDSDSFNDMEVVLLNNENGLTGGETVRSMIYWVIKTRNYGVSYGVFDYSSCFGGEYEDGMVCRLMLSSDGEQKYIPTNSENGDNHEGIDDYDEEVGQESDEEENIVMEEEQVSSKDEGDVLIKNAVEGKILDKDTTTYNDIEEVDEEEVELPFAGSTMLVRRDRVVGEFPWWLTVLILVGGVLFLWLFWPKKCKNGYKNEKNGKK